MQPALSAEELQRRLAAEFPHAFHPDDGLVVLEAGYGRCVVRLGFKERTLRPGGTISGPTIMMLADVAVYVAVLASIGWKPLAATTNLNINFLRKPPPGALLAACDLIRLGSRLAVGAVTIRSDGHDDLIAHATATYSIPPASK